MKDKLGIPEEDIQKVCLEYYTNYGTTMAGLVVSKLCGTCTSSSHLRHAWLSITGHCIHCTRALCASGHAVQALSLQLMHRQETSVHVGRSWRQPLRAS